MEKLTRAESKQRTRERLIEAAIQILRGEGVQGLSTRKLTRLAGVSQPSFYVHFEDMDDLVEAAGEHMAARLRASVRRYGGAGLEHRLRDASASRSDAVSDVQLFKLVMKHRRDDTSPLGRAAARFFGWLREDLKAELCRLGAGPDELPDLDLFVDIVGGLGLSVLEGIVDGRYADDAEALRAIDVAARGAYRALASDHRARRAERQN